MSRIPLQPGIIYGPILSRRLGRSLGINLLPVNRKVCSFNCIYCQYGEGKVDDSKKNCTDFPSVSEVLDAVRHAMKKPRTIEFLTLSGNGEPTLLPDFVEIVQGILSLRKELRPEARLGIFTNASRVHEPGINVTLQMFDLPMMKLDAGEEVTFKAINRPAHSIRFRELITGLKSLPRLMIQSLLFDGEVSNARGDSYEAWASLLAELNPKLIHIYSTARPTACAGVEGVSFQRLNAIAQDLEKRYRLKVMTFD